MVTCGCCAECEELKAPGPGRRAPPTFRDRGVGGHWGRRLPRPPPLDSSPRREEALPGCAARVGTRQSRGQPRAGVLLELSGEAWAAGMRGRPLFSEESGTGGLGERAARQAGYAPRRARALTRRPTRPRSPRDWEPRSRSGPASPAPYQAPPTPGPPPPPSPPPLPAAPQPSAGV
ncbi:centromere protein V-like [Piliocolobus tephrosceles]|uniref:centromere protein V-like n=1 Tax=Piliocolobus tephrosceles TaxID=591936 RepID=UPI000E6AEF40|nr:centromere protein V-like [Piliocolobus tephrosceles]